MPRAGAVVDVAHDPRLAADDEPSNQCTRYRDGEAHHFVELTPAGVLIRAQWAPGRRLALRLGSR